MAAQSKSSGSLGNLTEKIQIGHHQNTETLLKAGSRKHHSLGLYTYKLLDLGTAIGVMDIEGECIQQASASLMTFSKLEFAG